MNSVQERQFCTYFDRQYLLRGLALYRSLERHVGRFTLHVLCLDAAAYEQLQALQLAQMRLVTLAALEAAEPGLVTVKPHRSRSEYYFTLTPAWISYALQSVASGQTMTYLDADLYCFGDPAAADRELGDGAVLIVPHRFPRGAEQRERAGLYNVGYLCFRRDSDGEACLAWWRDACLAWCEDRIDGERYADQGYLNEFPRRFARVKICQHVGINAAPWNIGGYTVSGDSSGYRLNDQPLLVYHFHGLRRISRCVYDSDLAHYAVTPPAALLQLYCDYLAEIAALQQSGAAFGQPRTYRRLRGGRLIHVLSYTPIFVMRCTQVTSCDLRAPARLLRRLMARLHRRWAL